MENKDGIHKKQTGFWIVVKRYSANTVFPVWPMCSRQDFFDSAENGSAWTHTAHILPLVRCRRSVQSNMDRSLSNNNQIGRLNKEIKMYTKVL